MSIWRESENIKQAKTSCNANQAKCTCDVSAIVNCHYQHPLQPQHIIHNDATRYHFAQSSVTCILLQCFKRAESPPIIFCCTASQRAILGSSFLVRWKRGPCTENQIIPLTVRISCVQSIRLLDQSLCLYAVYGFSWSLKLAFGCLYSSALGSAYRCVFAGFAWAGT